MKILMVTPYPPIRDGIASYALQQVKALRAEGHEVHVLSPQPSAAHFHLNLYSPKGPLALLKRARKYDKVIIQFHPDVFYDLGFNAAERLRTTAALGVLARSIHNLEIVAHEVNYEAAARKSAEGWLTKYFWRNVDHIMVHTAAERARMAAALGLPLERIELLDHGSSFLRRVYVGQSEARHRLGLPETGHVFLSIGFVQEHKGFDRAVKAFAKLGEASAASMYVVGSVRVEEPHHLQYVEDLRHLVETTPGAHLRESYVSDELFDLWLVAADTVVLPYRHIWSSSVLERSALYDRQVIATRVGGLEAQAPSGTIFVDSDAELATAMQHRILGTAIDAVTRAPAAELLASEWTELQGDQVDREGVMAAVVGQATQRRGHEIVGFEDEIEGTTRIRQSRSVRNAKNALARFQPLELPPPRSTRPGVGFVKRGVSKLTNWQLRPIVERINDLTRATAEALDE
ncbi:MAG: glycosyltransferase family 4 protein [Acidimicrobiia bacterium]